MERKQQDIMTALQEAKGLAYYGEVLLDVPTDKSMQPRPEGTGLGQRCHAHCARM